MFTLNVTNSVTGVLDVTKCLNRDKPAPKVLKIECKEITGIINVPSTIKTIKIDGSSIQSLPKGSIPEGVTTLWMRSVPFKSFTDLNLPESLRKIWCVNTPVESFDGLPYGMIDITVHGGTMSSIDLHQYKYLGRLCLLGCHKGSDDTCIIALPDGLFYANLKDCNIRKIENLPNSVRTLLLEGNKELQRIEGLPRYLVKLTLPPHIKILENISRCKNLTSIIMSRVTSIGDHIRNDVSVQGLELNIDRDEVNRLTERFIDNSSDESQIQECDDSVIPSDILSVIQSHNYLYVVDGFLIEDDGVPLDNGRELIIVTSCHNRDDMKVRSEINAIATMASDQNINFTHVTDSPESSIDTSRRQYHGALSSIDWWGTPFICSIVNKTYTSFDYMVPSISLGNMTAENIITWYNSLSLEDHLRNTASVV